MADAVVFWLSGFGIGLWAGVTVMDWIRRPPRDRDRDWRRSFNHENANRPSGPPPLKLRRSKPVKPQFPLPRTIREDPSCND